MQSKSLLIAIAAFAVTATGVHAYGGSKVLTRAGLTEDQIEAVEEAQELRASGNVSAARDKLIEAGITESELASIRQIARDTRSLLHEALEKNDYELFRLAVANTPLGDIITTPTDFEQFREAHEFRLSNGEPKSDTSHKSRYLEKNHQMSIYTKPQRGNCGFDLSDNQLEALRVAKQANDRVTMQAIMNEAGLGNKSM
jgi:hypothetical protein